MSCAFLLYLFLSFGCFLNAIKVLSFKHFHSLAFCHWCQGFLVAQMVKNLPATWEALL